MNAQIVPLSQTRGYLGGGLIAAVLGLSPFLSPLDAYLQITEGDQEITPEQEEFFRSRRELEPWAAAKFTRKTGVEIVRVNHRFSDKEFSWAKAEIDAEAADGGNVETKTAHPNASAAWGDPDQDEPPAYVTAQAVWGMGVNGASHAYVNALIGFDDHRVYRIERDDELIKEIRRQAHDFWRFYVEPRRHPAPTNVDDLLRLYKTDSGRAVEATQDIRDTLDWLCQERHAVKLHEAKKLTHELTVKAFMRDATTLTVRGQAVATWRARADGIRTFRIK